MKAPGGVTVNVTTPRANANQHKIQLNFSLGPEYMDICVYDASRIHPETR